jgi:hypothetical protein
MRPRGLLEVQFFVTDVLLVSVLRAQDKGKGKRFVLWFRQVLRV